MARERCANARRAITSIVTASVDRGHSVRELGMLSAELHQFFVLAVDKRLSAGTASGGLTDGAGVTVQERLELGFEGLYVFGGLGGIG